VRSLTKHANELVLIDSFHEQGSPSAILYAQLYQDPPNMLFDRARTYAQGAADLTVSRAPRQAGVYLLFTGSQQSKAGSDSI